jgi:hypothetical protein
MKHILCVLVILFICSSASAQIAGGFTYSIHNGVQGVYFEAVNTLPIAYSIAFKAVKASNGFYYMNTMIVAPGAIMWAGPDTGWIWEKGDQMYIVYPNGQMQTWVYN